MKTSNLAMVQKSIENILKNWATALPTVLVMAIVLTMFHGLLQIQTRAKDTLENIQRKFSIIIYLKDDADAFEIGDLISTLEKRPDVVKPVLYTSKEQAFQMMNRTFSLDTGLLQKYKFSLPASLTITPKKLEDVKRIEAFLESSSGDLLAEPLVSKEKQKDLTGQMVEFIQNVRNSTLRNIIFFILIFIFGGTLLLSSTIHMAISSRHLEINIMKLVGASYSKITTPFVIEGILLGVLSFLLGLVLTLLLPMGDTIYPNALLFEFVAVILLSAGVSYFTVLMHLQKKTIV